MNLRCLYLGKNMIHQVMGLNSLTQLETLDLSENDIRQVEGLEQLTKLKFLSLSGAQKQPHIEFERQYRNCNQLKYAIPWPFANQRSCNSAWKSIHVPLLFQTDWVTQLLFISKQCKPFKAPKALLTSLYSSAGCSHNSSTAILACNCFQLHACNQKLVVV